MFDSLVAEEEVQPEWVKKQLGRNIIERVTSVGRDTMSYLDGLGMTVGVDRQRRFQAYMATTGRELLEMQLVDTGEEDRKREAMLKQMMRAGRVLRGHVKVSENEAGQKSVAIDKEWNTGSWTPEMIEAGMDCLFYVFLEDGPWKPGTMVGENVEKRPQAVIMLEKLLQRHTEARSYIQFKLDDLMTQALNSYIKYGKARAKLEILYIIHAAREKFIGQISEFSVAARAAELMSSEMRLAAIIIQQVFRVYMSTKSKKMDYSLINPIAAQFGSDEEMLAMRERAASLRTMDLKRQWNVMHQHMTRPARHTIGGFRGPCHIPHHFTTILLDIVLTVVSKMAGKFSPMNRENFIEGGGALILANFVSCPTSKFSYVSMQIIAHVSKVPASFRPCCESGCIKAIHRFLIYLKQTGKLHFVTRGTDGLEKMLDKSDEEKKAFQVHKFAFFDGVLALTKLAVHAAGFCRANGGTYPPGNSQPAPRKAAYGYKRPAQPDSEACNYLKMLQEFNPLSPPISILTPSTLGDKKLVKMLVKMTVESRHLQATRSLLLAIFTMSCSECHKHILFEVLSDSCKAAKHILNLLYERDAAVSSLSLCLFLQLNTLELARDTMIATEALRPHLATLTKPTSNFKRRPYQRAALIAASLLRQHDLRNYDPEVLPSFMSHPENVRKAVYLDLLKTCKVPTLETADSLTIADLVVMPFSQKVSMDMSLVAEDVGVADLAHFLVHPGEDKFIESLPWDEAAATCVILEALTRNCSTAEHLLGGTSVLDFLSRYMYISRYMVEQGRMSAAQLLILVNGLASAAAAMTSIVFVAIGYQVREAVVVEAVFGPKGGGFLDAAAYWLMTLSQIHEGMDSLVLSTMRTFGQNILGLADKIARLVLQTGMESITSPARVKLLLSLSPWAKTCAAVISKIHLVYAGQATLKYAVLEKTCRVCATLLEHPDIAREGVVKWGIIEALRIHLPTPAFGIGSTPDEAYSDAIVQMPLSLVVLLGEACQSDRGKGNCLTDGFLRRVLDKLHTLAPSLEANDVLSVWAEHIKRNPKGRFDEDKEFHASLMRRIVSECLRVIERCANFSSIAVGSCNDLILDARAGYKVVRICKEIVDKDACPKTDPAYLAALCLLAKLSQDSFRLDHAMKEVDVLGLVRLQMEQGINYPPQKNELPEFGVKACLEILQGLAGGHPSEYKTQQFFLFREVLGRVSQCWGGLEESVRRVNWEMFISSEKSDKVIATEAPWGDEAGIPSSQPQPHRTQTQPQPQPQPRPTPRSEWNGETFDYENDRIVRETLQKLYVKAGLPEESNLLSNSRQSSRQSSRVSSRHSSRPTSAAVVPQSDSWRNSFDSTGPKTGREGIAGTYDACGVNSCGSLKLRGAHPDLSSEHGKFRDSPSELVNSLALNVPTFLEDGTTLNVTNLSAREPALRNAILERKSRTGFVGKIMSPIRDTRVKRQKPHGHGPTTASPQKLMPLPSSGVPSTSGAPRSHPLRQRGHSSPMSPVALSVDASFPELLRTRPPIDDSGPFIC